MSEQDELAKFDAAMREQLAAMVLRCYETEPLMAEYERLHGERPRLSVARNPMEAAIDRACGFTGFEPSPEWGRFVQFVFATVFLPVKTAQVEEAIREGRL